MTILSHFPDYVNGIICLLLVIAVTLFVAKSKIEKRFKVPYVIMIPPLTWFAIGSFIFQIGASKKLTDVLTFGGLILFGICIAIGFYFKFKYEKEKTNRDI